MSGPSPPPAAATKYDKTLGAVLIGGMLSMGLSGMAFSQIITYFTRKTKVKDGFFFKLIIAVLWCLDLLDSAFIIHLLYTYMVINYNNPGYLVHTTWSLSLHSIEICVNNASIRAMFIWKYYQLSRNITFTISMAACSVTAFISSMILILKVLLALSFSAVDKLRPLYYIANVGNICSDLSIFLGLAWLFHRSKTGFGSTDNILNNLILFCITAGILVVIDVAVGIIVFAAFPKTWYYMAARLLLSKLFLISYFAMINFREHIRKDFDDSIPLSDFIRSRGDASHMRSQMEEKGHSKGLSISIQTSTQKRVDDLVAAADEKVTTVIPE